MQPKEVRCGTSFLSAVTISSGTSPSSSDTSCGLPRCAASQVRKRLRKPSLTDPAVTAA